LEGGPNHTFENSACLACIVLQGALGRERIGLEPPLGTHEWLVCGSSCKGILRCMDVQVNKARTQELKLGKLDIVALASKSFHVKEVHVRNVLNDPITVDSNDVIET
jgi:hypothetical protein